MRYALLALLLAGCAESPVAPEVDAMLPVAGSVQASTTPATSPTPAGDVASYTWEVGSTGEVRLFSNVDQRTTVRVVWYQFIPNKGWRHNYELAVDVPAHGSTQARVDCFYFGRYRIEAPGHGLHVERDFGPSLGQPYCGTGPGVWTW